MHNKLSLVQLGLLLFLLVGCSKSSLAPVSHSVQYFDNGLAKTPAMGWSSWFGFQAHIDENTVKSIADYIAASGLKDAGYQYVNIDDGWELPQRKDGHLQADPAKFPGGIKALADYVHARGLKLGVYSSVGDQTCLHNAGSYGHEQTDAQDFADWGVDYLKFDYCQYSGSNVVLDFQRMGACLMNTGRPIVYSIVLGFYADWAASCGNSWRTYADYGGSWSQMEDVINHNELGAAAQRPGNWNDPDNIHPGLGTLTLLEEQTELSLWAVSAAPLIMGNDPRKLNTAQLALLTNPEVLAIDQDALGIQGTLVWKDQTGHLKLYVKKLADGSVACLLVNFNDDSRSATLSLAYHHVRDVWQRTDLNVPFKTSMAFSIPAHGVLFLKCSQN